MVEGSAQPIGDALPGWKPAVVPTRTPMEGRWCRVEPLAVGHVPDLWEAFSADSEDRMWTYMGYGPFPSRDDLKGFVEEASESIDPLFFAILSPADGPAAGFASYLRQKPVIGVIEVGNLTFSPRLQRTAAATEAMYLMARRVFEELGYRRYEWKGDALNAASRRAAERLGFVFEGVFRQAAVYKHRNRDTAWYSMLDGEWPVARSGFEAWLDPANFDAQGRQRRPLVDCRDGRSLPTPRSGA